MAVARQSYIWSFPICPHDVALDLSVARALEYELSVDAGPRQGLLIGVRKPGLTRITAAEPLPALDAAEFAAHLFAARRIVVGYYRIRQGCAFIFDPAEIALAQALFPEQGSVVLLVERRESGGAHGAFAFWRGEAFVSNLPCPFPLDAAALAAQPLPAPREPESAEPRRSILRRNAWPIGLVAAAAFAIIGPPKIWLHGVPPPELDSPVTVAPAVSPPVPPVSHTPADIRIVWDRRGFSTATAGVLKVADGAIWHHVSLDLEQLRSGSVVYTPSRGPVSAEMKVLLANGEIVEVPVTQGPAMPVAPPMASIPVQVVRAAPAGTSSFPLPTPPTPPRRIVRRFEPSFAVGTTPAREPALPDAPQVQLVPSAAVPVLAASLPAPPAPPRIRLGHLIDRSTVAGSGRLIWTGNLARRGVVEFDGRSVSVGSLTGSLPGVPVHVTASPAEFAGDGVVVYTADPRMHGRVEPPGTANGWNRVTYIWEPERVRQIAVLEAPNPSNHFSHLALRSDARHVSMLVINWQAETPATR